MVLNGSNATFNVTVAGTGPFTYQWRFNGTNLPNNIITTVAGNGINGYSGDGGTATNANLKTPRGIAFDAIGNLFITDYGNYRIRKVDATGIITTFAGNGTNGYSGDGGAATNAKIVSPFGVAVDANGNLLIADRSNYRIRKVDTNGIITTVAGNGSAGSSGDGGAATNAKLNSPSGAAVDSSGNLLIADTFNGRIRKVDTNGVITTVAGKGGNAYSGDGNAATNAFLNNPNAVAADASGDFFIADTSNNRIRKVDANGIITTVAGNGTVNYSGDGGPAINASLAAPDGVAVDTYGFLYIADNANNRIRQVDASGVITTLAGDGNAGFSNDGGPATNASLSGPFGVALDPDGNLLFSDNNNNRIRKIVIGLGRYPNLVFKGVTASNAGNYDVIITGASGSVTSSVVTLTVLLPPIILGQPQNTIVTNGSPANLTVAVSGTEPLNYQWFFNSTTTVDGGTNAVLSISNASTSQAGNYFCVVTNDYGSVTSRIVTLSAIVFPGIPIQPTNQVVIAGVNATLTVIPSGTGPFTYQWQLNGTNLPHSFGTNIYYSPNTIMTVAGNGNAFVTSNDGIPATSAALLFSQGVAADPFGNFFIAETSNSRVRKVGTDGIIWTAAGTGVFGFTGDGGAATNAQITYPIGIVSDTHGNLFFTDAYANNNRIRKMATNGIITTVSGTNSAGFSGDGGPASAAQLNNPTAVAVDNWGNLFVADTGNNRIRKIDTNGIITTIAGTSTAGYSGDGGAATIASLKGPHGVTVDAAGNCYVADTTNNCIRKIDINGIITTWAGNGTAGYSGDGGPATNASLNRPYGLAVDADGAVFVADYNNHSIRMIRADSTIATVAGNGQSSIHTNGFYIFGAGDGGAATNANLYNPTSVSIDVAGNLLIADEGNNRIRKVDFWRVSALALTSVTPNNAGDYQVIISSPYGSVTSSIVTMVFPPSITAQPYGVTVINGGAASFGVTTFGTGLMSYQWYFNTTTAMDYGTNATLPIVNVGPDQTGNYFCVITNTYGSVTSRVVTLAIGLPPAITTQATNQVAISGNSTTFGVAVFGTGPFTYQWQCNGTNIPNNIITTVAGNGTGGFSGDGGAATNAALAFPNSAAMDIFGNLFIADRANYRIRKVSANGVITTIGGNGTQFSLADGGPATNSSMYAPVGLAVDAVGNIFVADVNERRIRKIGTNGVIATMAGGGADTGNGGLATNARFFAPTDVAVDSSGNIFIADSSGGLIREVNANGIITTVAGNGSGGFSGDGGAATNASLSSPEAVGLDASGNVFIADSANVRIRKVDTNGVITTVAGNGIPGYSGDGGAATNASLYAPEGVAVDPFGNLYVSEYGNNRIRQIGTNGIITTVAGNGPTYPATGSYSGDGGAATNASLYSPQRISIDASGNLLIADQHNGCIRRVALGGNPMLTLNNLTTNNAGNYDVIITSPYGSVVSSNVSLTVLVPPSITGILPNTDGSLTLNFTGGAGQTYLVQATTNLIPPVVWQTLSTNVAGQDSTWQLTDTNTLDCPARFYRACLPQ